MKKVICFFICVCFMIQSVVVFAEGNTDLGLNAKSVILMEEATGNILYESNPDERLPIASVTKVMTMLLIMEAVDSGKINLDDMVTVSENAMSYGGSTMFLETGEQLTVNDMLKGIAVASANDGCVAMAEHLAGSESAFVDMMNEKAKELGMENTHFMNTRTAASGRFRSLLRCLEKSAFFTAVHVSVCSICYFAVLCMLHVS